MRGMILWQRVEGALVLSSVVVFFVLEWPAFAPWWGLVLLFFAPDVAFLAYAVGPKVGAFVYNLLHSYGTFVLLLLVGWLAEWNAPMVLAVLWIGHAGFDRMLGYGLKSGEGFTVTHLGRIGKDAAPR